MGIKIYKVSFVDNYSTEFKTPLDLTTDYIKQELEKLTSIEVKQVLKLDEVKKFPVTEKPDLYFSVDYDYLGAPLYHTRILIPKLRDDITRFNVESKLRTFVDNIYGSNVSIPSIKYN